MGSAERGLSSVSGAEMPWEFHSLQEVAQA